VGDSFDESPTKAVTLTQLRLGSFVAKPPYPSPLKGEERARKT
jgi:hypothetical protein